MKTLKDLEEMKNESRISFGTLYDNFFAVLADYYVGKTYGVERIKAELHDWDKEAQYFIVNELANRISESGIMEFDRNELLSLIQ